jgi:hypothetical protein
VAKEMDLAMQTSYADGRWQVTFNGWLGTEKACDAMIEILKVARPLLAENDLEALIEKITPENVHPEM